MKKQSEGDQSQKFSEWAREFQETKPIADENSHAEIQQKVWAFKNHLVPFFGHLDLEDIGALHIDAYKALKLRGDPARHQKPLKTKTINNHLIILRRALRVAKEYKKLQEVPEIKPMKVKEKEPRFLSRDEISRLLEAAKGATAEDPAAPWEAMVRVALNTGLRIGELQALRWSDVDMVARSIVVRHSLDRAFGELKAPKNEKSRKLALNDKAYEALKGVFRIGEFVFGKRPKGEPYTYMGCQKALARLMAEAGIKGAGWHTLRHTFASHLVMGGTPLYHVRDLLGHSSLAMTQVYAHLAPETTKAAVDLLSQSFDELEPDEPSKLGKPS